MSLVPFLRAWFGRTARKSRPFVKRSRLHVELLEERSLLSGPPPIVNIPPAPPTQGGPALQGPGNPANPGDPTQSGTPSSNPPASGGTGQNGPSGSLPSPGSDPFANASKLITKLYEDLLHRSGGADEISGWTSLLLSGVPARKIAMQFTASAEYRSDLIRENYRTVLGRDPGGAEIGGWMPALQSGWSEKQLTASFLASPEFFTEQGGTDFAWLNGMYGMVLRRAPDSAGVGTWSYFMDLGLSRSQVALAFLNSAEANAVMVDGAYATYLQRQASPGETWGWVLGLPASTSANQLMSMVVSAPEYVTVPENMAELSSSFENISGITPDSGISSSDGITNAAQVTLSGSGTANASFVVAVDGAVNGWASSGNLGTWTTTLPGALTGGKHTIAVRVDDGTGSFSNPAGYATIIELAAPSVSLQATVVAGTGPAVTVTATDNLPFSSQVTIDVDVKHDGTFSDPGDMNYSGGSLVGGKATIPLSGLADGVYLVRARVSDLAGNEGVSPKINFATFASGSSGADRLRLEVLPKQIPPGPLDPNLGFIGSQTLLDLLTAYTKIANSGAGTSSGAGSAPSGGTLSGGSTSPGGTTGSAASVAAFIQTQSHYYAFDSSNDILVRVRLRSRNYMDQAASDLQNSLGMTISQVFPDQNTIEGYLPIASLLQVTSVTDFGAITPVYAAILNVGAVTTQGDGTVKADSYRGATGMDGTGITVGAISDSVNQVDNTADGNPDKGIAESQRTGDLPASGVNVLQDGSSGSTDEGRGILEIVHDVAPGASLAFTTAIQGPQAMAKGIVDLATKAGAKVIVDDVSFPDEPFLNDGLVAQAVDQVVNQNNVLYVTSAGNYANNAWTDQFRPVSATVAGTTGTFTNFESGSGQNLVQQFTLQPGQTLDLAFQWDSPFVEGGSPLPQLQVPNSLAVRVLDGAGARLLKSFADVNQNTGEAFQRVIFTNDGSFGTNTFGLAFQLMSGPAPTTLKWIRFDGNAPAQYQGAPAIWGHAAARGALTVGAVPFDNPQSAEPFTSQGKATILFDAGGNALAQPEIRNKPDVAGPDGVWTANFPALGPGQAPGSFPVFTGTSAAAAHVAGVAALLRQKIGAASPAAIDKAIVQAAKEVGPAGWDAQTGAGLVQLSPTITAASTFTGRLKVGPIVDVSHSIKPNDGGSSSGASGGSGQTGSSSVLLNLFPNVNTTAHVNNEWEEDIAIDPLNPNNLFLGANEDTAEPGLFVSYSKDGGKTWNARIIADGTDNFTKSFGDPSVSWDNFGNLFLSYLNGVNPPDHAVLLTSADGGVTFTELGTFPAIDQPKVTTGAGSVWLVFNNTDLEAVGAPVTGLGAIGAFGSPESVPNSSGGNFGTISIGPAGQVLVSYQDSGSGSGPDTIMTALDPDGLGGAGFNNAIAATPTNVGSFRAITPQPARTIDADGRVAYDRSAGPHKGRVYLDYVDAPTVASNDTNIFVRYSDDNGTTWSPPVRVNDDKGTNSQFWPRLAVDQTTGNIAISWYDCRNDPGSGPGDTNGKPNDDTEFFASASVDGGNTFIPNVQVAQGPSSAIANNNNTNDYGDYSGLAFYAGSFYPAWADNSNSTGNNPDGRLSGFDVYTAKISLSALVPFTGQQDADETNQTSDKATNLGVLISGATINNMGITPLLLNGLPDYDWYRWSAGQAGTFTATLDVTAQSGDLEMHIFTVNSQDTLIELGNTTTSQAHGITTLSLSTPLTSGEPILVEVKGKMFAPGKFGQGEYDVTVSLQ